MARIFLLVIGLNLLLACSTTKNWKGSDEDGHNYASFDEFSGKQDFTMKLQQGSDCFVNYDIKVSGGRLHMLVKSPNKVILDTSFTSNASDLIVINKNSDSVYTLVLAGSKAKGSFDVKYGTR